MSRICAESTPGEPTQVIEQLLKKRIAVLVLEVFAPDVDMSQRVGLNGQKRHEEGKAVSALPAQTQSRLLTVGELAKILQVPESWIYQRTRLGPHAIPVIRMGKYVRFDLDEVVRFFKQKNSEVNEQVHQA